MYLRTILAVWPGQAKETPRLYNFIDAHEGYGRNKIGASGPHFTASDHRARVTESCRRIARSGDSACMGFRVTPISNARIYDATSIFRRGQVLKDEIPRNMSPG